MKSLQIVALAAALTLTSQAPAQNAAPGSPAATATKAKPAAKKKKAKRKDHYSVRVKEIAQAVKALPADTTGTIVMLGDSITEGFFRQKQMPEKIDGVLVVNEGISGDQIDRPTSGTGVTHRVNLVKKAKPAVVFVLIGINDFWGGKETPEQVLPQYEKMFKMLKEAAPQAKFVWQSVLPTSKANAYMNANVDKLNTRIQQLAQQAGDTYLDLHPAMEDEKGELKAAFTGDGVHLNVEGYQTWLKEIKKTVKDLLK